jgi:sulfur dioxygenase
VSESRKTGSIPYDVMEISAEQLDTLAGDVRRIDVREPSEFHGELSHLEGAELVPLAQIQAACAAWDREGPLLLVCRSGRRSLEAARRLQAAGFERVMNLRGGMIAVRELEARRRA